MYLSYLIILVLAIAESSAIRKAEGKFLRYERQDDFHVLQREDDIELKNLEERVEALVEAVQARSRHNAVKKGFFNRESFEGKYLNDYEHGKKNIDGKFKKMQSHKEEFEDEEDFQVEAKAALTNSNQELKDRVQAMKDEIEVEKENRSPENKYEEEAHDSNDEELITRIDELKSMLARTKSLSFDDEEETNIEDNGEEVRDEIEDDMNNTSETEENHLKEELHNKVNMLKVILSRGIDEELQDETNSEDQLVTLKEMLNNIDNDEETTVKEKVEEIAEDVADQGKDIVNTHPKNWTTIQIVLVSLSGGLLFILSAFLFACCFCGLGKK
eukprot:CAMPEP_0194165888 /NCGR_PEP_ID=MMETSP0154-20130528/1685_1 /TAXON_ID=1049557 /ORGANISM="Thalassiothrix antarctica, Strain L6-D1" /LENGTH=328 /DNA_ID=CAMNT_0038876441 /DNA_START=53 /DNA_END=1039 /DNA_ORIENTATION=+